MSSIATAIKLNDQMSNPIQSIINTMNMMLSAWESLESSTSDGLNIGDVESIKSELDKASHAMENIENNADQAARGINNMDNQQQQFNSHVQQGAGFMDGLGNKITGAVGAYMSLQGVTNFITSAMEGSNLEANIVTQLGNVLKNVGSTKDAFRELNEESQKFEANGMYGATEMLAGAAELATYISDPEAIKSMMGTLANYATGMSGGGALNSDQIVEYGTQLGKALMGTYDGLSKKGFELTDVQKKIIDGTATQAEVADELGLTLNEVALMSEDMQKALVLDSVIGESWDGLYESMSNTPEGKIAMLQNAWGDVMDSVGHMVTPAVLKLFDTIRENMPAIKSTIMGISSVLVVAVSGVEMLVDNWSSLAPIIGGVVTAMGLYIVALGIYKGVAMASAAAEALRGAATSLASGATFAATANQYGFNSALLACPITWIVLAILTLIVVLYAAVNAWNEMTGECISATGMLGGALMVAVAFIWNLFVALVDFLCDCINAVANPWIQFANFFANIFNAPIESIINAFRDLASNVLNILFSIADAIDTVFGSDLRSAVGDWQNSLDSMIADLSSQYGEGAYEKIIEEWDLKASDFGISRWSYDDAFEWGYYKAEKLEADVEGMFAGLDNYSVEDLLGEYSFDDQLAEIEDNTDETNESAGSIEQALDITNENLKYLRDLAEQETINRFTTAEIKVEMGGVNNTVNHNTDLDGVIDYMVTGVQEAMERVAEGVHN